MRLVRLRFLKPQSWNKLLFRLVDPSVLRLPGVLEPSGCSCSACSVSKASWSFNSSSTSPYISGSFNSKKDVIFSNSLSSASENTRSGSSLASLRRGEASGSVAAACEGLCNSFSRVYILAAVQLWPSGTFDPGRPLQLLEIAVCNVVTGPLWHGVELYAVRELHLEQPLSLCEALSRSQRRATTSLALRVCCLLQHSKLDDSRDV